MTTIIPNCIDQENPKLNGERLVFNMFSNLESNGIVLYSVWQKNQEHKLFGEIDFLLITKRGLICFEVKGGVISREAGEWFSTDKNDKKNKIKNPFNQAKDCMYALIKHIKSIPKFKDVIVGMGVIFPECIFNVTGNDIVSEVKFDYGYNGSFKDYISATYKYWEDKYLKTQNIQGKILSDKDIIDLQVLLRSDINAIPVLNTEIEYLDKQIIQLTKEQSFILNDLINENDRLLIQGVAGTGKSIIAMEQVQKLIVSGKKVAYICFNSNMAKYAQCVIGNISKESYVGTFNHLLGIDFNNNINLSESCKNFLKNNIVTNKYDILIVDEAQDLMDLNIIEALSLFLNDGIEKGKWVFLYDPNQNIFKSSHDFNETIEYLKKGCGAFSYKLNTNCRNTKQIASKVAAITKTGAAHIMNISGQDVVIEPYEDDKELVSKLKYRIQSLITGGIRPHNIIILSKYKLKNSGLKNTPSICNYSIKEMHDLPETDRNSIKYYTVQSFKGLDEDIIFYIDIDGFSDVNNRMLNYVGLSRAKSLLYAYYKESVKKDFYNFILND